MKNLQDRLVAVSGRINARTGRGVVRVTTVDGVKEYASLDEALKDEERS